MVNYHPLGVGWGSGKETCGSCAWSRMAGPGPKVMRCVAANNKRIDAIWRACCHWENTLDCLDCAACCGPAFDAVEVGARDPVRKKHPESVVIRDGRYQIPRTKENFCQNLGKGNLCAIYSDRPKCCREFERSSSNCHFARKRVGLSQSFGSANINS